MRAKDEVDVVGLPEGGEGACQDLALTLQCCVASGAVGSARVYANQVWLFRHLPNGLRAV
jgi:hypothetical protein